MSSSVAQTIPDHELLKCIGGGSYGDVWLARNVLGELRAVKIVHRSTFDDDRPFEREFEGIRRFEPISRSHPSQLHILHVGRGDGCFYYVMELADDANSVVAADVRRLTSKGSEKSEPSHVGCHEPRTLKLELKRRGRLPPAECVEIGLALTTALAHLHAHDLVHRDIKPSNIIFVSGVPKLADIGLVTDVDASRSFVGTEGFLPPEGPGTPQADLYSLGKVLYEMSTGRDRKDYPALPLDWDSLDPAEQSRLLELNEVLVKVCEAHPRRRYRTAEQLRVDLELLQGGQSVRQTRATQRRWSITWKTALAAALVGIISLAVHRFGNQSNTSATEVQRWYLEGRVLFGQNNPDAIRKALLCFNKAIAADSGFAPAFVGLSECHRWSGDYTNAKQAALRAIQLDDRLGDAHAELAIVKRTLEWDWTGAESQFKRAIELKPSRWVAYLYYAGLLVALGRTEEALAMTEQGARVEPLSEHGLNEQGAIYYFAHQYDRVIDRAQAALRINRNFERAHLYLWLAYMGKGMHAEAVAALQRFDTLHGESPDEIAEQRRAFDEQGIGGFLRKRLDWTLRSDPDPMIVAQFYAQLNEPGPAFQWLEKAVEARSPHVMFLRVNPHFDNVRADPRFAQILKRVGLPAQ